MRETQIDALTTFLALGGLEVEVTEDERIEIVMEGEAQAFIELDEPWQPPEELDYLYDGCSLRVTAPGRPRAQQAKHALMKRLAAIDEASGGRLFGRLGREVCADWREVILP